MCPYMMWMETSSSEDENEVEQPNRTNRIHRERINFLLFMNSAHIERFRILLSTTEKVLNLIGAKIMHKTNRNHALSPKQQLLTTLHFLGTNCQYHGVSNMHGMVKSTVCRTIHRVADAIIQKIFGAYVRWPNNCAFIPIGFNRIARCLFINLIAFISYLKLEQEKICEIGKRSEPSHFYFA